MIDEPIVIIAARRTPIGAFQGQLEPIPAPQLGATAIRAVVADGAIDRGDVDEVLMGCVLSAGLGQAPARIASIGAELPSHVGATTINKVCGSGMRSVMLGCDMLRAGSARIVVAGGMESMSRAPYLLPSARGGYRLGHHQVLDHMLYDGLEDGVKHQSMGYYAEQCAAHFGFTREAQDAYTLESYARARAACADGAFKAEIIPVHAPTRRGEVVVAEDEEPYKVDLARIAQLRPVFKPEGTVTAASSSSISDGAAALLLMTASEAQRRGCQPLGRIVGHDVHAQEPAWFTTAPIKAIAALQSRLGWRNEDVDLYEINEAFAVVAMAAMRELELAHAKVNVHGGACALGHPIGASGARILVTLLHALRARGGGRGIASLCIGGGEATVIAVECD